MTEPEPERVLLPGSLSVGRNCFACGPDNEHGLQVPYAKVGDAVEAEFTLSEKHSGAPAFVHGGLVMTILDEAMAWATISLRARFAVTTQFSVAFSRPVLIGQAHTVRATCGELGEDGRTLVVTAAVARADGKTCAEARGRYYSMSVEETAASLGLAQLPEELQAFGFARPQQA